MEWQASGYHYEGPICVHGNHVYFATFIFEHPILERARDEARRNWILQVHRVGVRDGRAKVSDLTVRESLIPAHWSFIQYNSQVIFYSGHFHLIAGATHDLAEWPYGEVSRGVTSGSGPTSVLPVVGDKLIFASQTDSFLYCFDLTTYSRDWALDLSHADRSAHGPSVGPPALADSLVVCFGRDALNWVEPATGTVTRQLRLPRILKLFPPVACGDDLLLPYTNWTSGGVLRYSPSAHRTIWKYTKRFQGPGRHDKLVRFRDLVIWVKGETEIIAVDVNTGNPAWAVPASPWLYTGIDLVNETLIFGTAGRGGYLHCIDAATGETRWSLNVSGGCAYYAFYGNSVLVGDAAGLVRRADAATGTTLDELQLDVPVVGRLVVHDGLLFTAVWLSANRPPGLACIDLAG